MPKKIKICYVASADTTIKFILFNHLKFLKSEGLEVQVACSFGKWVEEIKGLGIKVKIVRFKRKIFTPFHDLFALVKLFFYFKKEKFDIVHTHTPKPGLLGQLAAKMAGVPIVVNTIHGLYFTNDSSILKRMLFIFIEKIAAKCSDVIFFVNKEDIDTVLKEKICGKEKIRYFGGGIDLRRFSPVLFSDEFILRKKKELNIPPNKKIIGIVARFVKEKGYLDLFVAFKTILKTRHDVLLMIVAQKEPEKKDAIKPDIVKKYGIENNTIFLGERTDVEQLYSLIDVFVLPSYREGLGISLLEAEAMEKPVVATNIRGCREAVEDGKTGILVSVKNPQEIAKAIIYLFSNPKTAERMGRAGRGKILREFDERQVFDRIKKEYDRLIEYKINGKSSDFKKNF